MKCGLHGDNRFRIDCQSFLKSVVTELMKDLVDSQGLLLFISTFFISDLNRIVRFADTEGELVSCIQDSKRFNVGGKWSIPTR